MIREVKALFSVARSAKGGEEMTNAEINAKVLEIIGWKPTMRCSPNGRDLPCAYMGCKYYLKNEHGCEKKLASYERKPDFFAAGANPMMLLAECERQNLIVIVSMDFSIVNAWNILTLKRVLTAAGNCKSLSVPFEQASLAAALARAIVGMEEKK